MSTPVTVKASKRIYPEQVLTPRTPHSRAGSFKNQQVNEPLLGDSRDGTPALFSDGLDRKAGPRILRVLHYVPLAMGSMCGVMLFILAIISYRRPEVIYWMIGENDWALSKGDNHTGVEVPTAAVHDHAGIPAENAHPELIIDYSNYSTFPLTSMEYAGECWKLNQQPHKHGAYWDPGQHGIRDVVHKESPGTCSSSITYMLDGEIGLAADLALMAQVAGLARERNRTFFVDDTFWNRGSWLEYFEDVGLTQPWPEPGCLPPPPEELVACPRFARHWIVTSHTAKFHMGHAFSEEYEDPYKQSINRQRPIFETGRLSLSTSIIPNSGMIDLINQAKSILHGAPFVGVHVRRGDQHAMSWRYHKGYVPMTDYLAAAKKTLPMLDDVDTVYIASDAPSALVEFSEAAPQDWNIHASPVTTGSRVEYSVDEEVEGYYQDRWDEIPQEDRIALTRGMIIDLALVTGAWASEDKDVPAAVVCALSSHVCRIAAMTLGWERAIEEKRWVEVDNRGDIEPVWDAFKLYH